MKQSIQILKNGAFAVMVGFLAFSSNALAFVPIEAPVDIAQTTTVTATFRSMPGDRYSRVGTGSITLVGNSYNVTTRGRGIIATASIPYTPTIGLMNAYNQFAIFAYQMCHSSLAGGNFGVYASLRYGDITYIIADLRVLGGAINERVNCTP